MANKIGYILFTAAISMAACLFGETFCICSDKPCSIDYYNTRAISTNRVELRTYDSAYGWYIGNPLIFPSNDFYRVVKQGYRCNWYTYSKDCATARDDGLGNCTSLLLENSYAIDSKKITTKAKKTFFGQKYRLACAMLTPLTYQVSFDGNGGSSPSGITVTFDSTYVASEDAWPTSTRTGYDFNGWYTQKEGGTKILWNTTVSTPSSHTLYAQWTAHTHTAYLKSEKEGATISPSQISATYGSPYPAIADPTLPGHDFDFWAREKSGSNPVTPGTTLVQTDDDHTLWAQWIAKKYEVTLDPCGGTISSVYMNPTIVTFGQTFGSGTSGSLPTPDKDGYEFKAWYTKKDGEGDKVEQGAMFTFLTNITIFAHYEPRSYTLVYNAQGGTIDGQYERTIVFDSPYGHLATPTRAGYSFDHWWTEPDGCGTMVTETNIVSSTKNPQTIYANWNPNPYTVAFEFCGGSNGTESVAVQYGTPMSDIVPPMKEGYSFAGYYDNSQYTGLSYYNSDGKGVRSWEKTGDGVLHAKWGEKTYMVTFDKCGGSGGTVSQQVTYKGTLNKVYPPSRIGYTFAGYYTGRDGIGVRYFAANGDPLQVWSISGDATLYAHWTPITYYVSFVGNSGSGSMADQEFKYGEAKELALNVFSKPGLRFVNWKCTSPEGFYTDGQVVSNLTTQADDYVYLRAQWSQTRYVRFSPGSGSGEMPLMEFEGTEAKCLVSNAFTRTGYTFDYWTNGTGTVYADGQYITNSLYVGIAQTNDLHAVWSNNVYTIFFSGNGATNSMASVSATYDVPQRIYSTFRHPDVVAKFSGWGLSASGDPEFPAEVGLDYAVVSNVASKAGAVVTLYAHWGIDYGELSDALDCENLRFEGERWKVTEGVEGAYRGTCAICDATVESSPSWTLKAKGLKGSGVLMFNVNTTYNDAEISVMVGDAAVKVVGKDYPGRSEKSWFTVLVALTNMVAENELKLNYNKQEKEEYCAIDHLSWTPDSDHPEPTAADAPAITGGATIEGGKFRVTFAADKRFKYELEKTSSLTPVDWRSFVPQMYISPDASGTVSFEPEMKGAEPQMFYRVKVLKKD